MTSNNEPGPGVPPAPPGSRAVFLSYASQDAHAAASICAALRAAGVEVWFDQSELRGGDTWDHRIRAEIRDCALFAPLISANTQQRPEGYFRLEWKLAVDRSHLMAAERVFLLPVVIDATREAEALVPERFREVQWSSLPGGAATQDFIERVMRLLDQPLAARGRGTPAELLALRPAGNTAVRWIALALAVLVTGYFMLDGRLPFARHPAQVAEQSIAVLPFVDLSQDKDQEYFSDGLAEELLDMLAKTPGLHVIARTSSFVFKGKSVDLATIGKTLKVANILEGSVRKSGNHLRVTTQLVRADTAEPLWSETYEREATDIFKVQDDIAAAVLSVLKLKLAQGHPADSRGTSSPDAFNEYLLGRQQQRGNTVDGFQRALAAYRRAVALDPHYAAAYAGLASAQYRLADLSGDASGVAAARSYADRAIGEGPDQADGYAVRGDMRARADWDWRGALSDLEKAVALDPGDSHIQDAYGTLLGLLGRFPEAIAALATATRLDPLSPGPWDELGLVLAADRDFRGARAAFERELEIQPQDPFGLDNLGNLQLLRGAPAEALATYRKIGEAPLRDTGIAMAEYSLGNTRQSQQALDAAIAAGAIGFASQIADVYAWRHENDPAIEWLERAHRQHDGGLAELNTDLLLGSLREDPRFRALRREINLPY